MLNDLGIVTFCASEGGNIAGFSTHIIGDGSLKPWDHKMCSCNQSSPSVKPFSNNQTYQLQ